MFVFVVWVFSYHKLVAKPQKTLHVPSKGSAVHGVEARHRDRKAFLPESFGRAGGRLGGRAFRLGNEASRDPGLTRRRF